MSGRILPAPRRGASATPSTPESVPMRSTAPSPSGGAPRSPCRQAKEGCGPAIGTAWVSTWVIRMAAGEHTSYVCSQSTYGRRLSSSTARLSRVSDSSQAERSSRPDPDDGNGWSIARRPARLSVVVVESLLDGIVSGRYPPGTLLPPEPVLCQTFDVSRSVVREAMKALEEKGLARARQGHGTTISPPDD